MAQQISHIRPLLLTVLLALTGCATIPPDTGPVQMPPRKIEKEQAIAHEGHAYIYQQGHIMQHPELTRYVTQVGRRIAAVSDRSDIPYFFFVIGEDSLNAFTIGYGHVYVHSGLIARMGNEAQLASVLAHEIAHVTRYHVIKSAESRRNKGIFFTVLGHAADIALSLVGAGGIGQMASGMAVDTVHTVSTSGFSRAQEDQADRVGIDYLFRAGYDPREFPKIFEIFLRESGDQSTVVNFVYGDHSTNSNRLRLTRELVRSRYEKELPGRDLTVDTPEFQRIKRALSMGMYGTSHSR